MNAEQILAHLRKQPFEPFRVFMSDWSSYEVRYPELAIGATVGGRDRSSAGS